MPPKYGSPEHWLMFAQSDLALASSERTSDVLFETLCFHSQQAAEKAIKAVFVFYDIPFPFTHNLAYLVDVLLKKDIKLFDKAEEVVTLSKYSTSGRYPLDVESIKEDEYFNSIRIAKRVLVWAKETIRNES